MGAKRAETRRRAGTTAPAHQSAERLLVEHCGDVHVVEVGRGLTFGRAADLVVDVNPYLHRVLGRFRHDGRSWWLDNVGSSLTLTLLSNEDLSSATLGPGSSAPVLQVESVVSFTAGPANHELAITNERAERLADLGVQPDGPLVTLEWGHVELSSDQIELLAVLCAARLERPSDQWATIPSNRECAVALGWTLAKYNRKLDHLCNKLARSGVRGLHGDLGLSALDRRRNLIDHVVRNALLDRALVDRALLDRALERDLTSPAAPLAHRRG